MEAEQAAAGQDAPVATPVLTIGKGQDRIPSDKPLEELVAVHGAGSVYVDGKCYAEILADNRAAESAANAALAGDTVETGTVAAPPVTETEAAPAVNAAEGAGDHDA